MAIGSAVASSASEIPLVDQERLRREDPDKFRAWHTILGGSHRSLGPMHFDRRGRPMTMYQWAERFEHDFAYRIVASTYVGPYRVSTVWLGIDHGFGSGGRPLIFETMVFGRRPVVEVGLDGRGYAVHPTAFDDLQLRWATEREALRGHAVVRKMVRRDLQRRSGPPPMSTWVRRRSKRGGDG